MFFFTPSLDDIRRDLASDRQEVRYRALNKLCALAKKHRKLRPEAMEMLKASALAARDGWTATTAARAYAELASAADARAFWLRLFDHPSSQVADVVVLLVDAKAYADELIALFHRRDEIGVRCAILRTLGRSRVRAAASLLVDALDIPALRPSAAAAVGEFCDASLIPNLEPLLSDKTVCGVMDNHGPELRIADVAAESIRQLRDPRR